ncbi:MAG TPA: hypothetical protein GX744_03715 [Firmicutes bacterium]|jgi:hypothetical protein|nr:hypothetical protein [Bacillota bacterium]
MEEKKIEETLLCDEKCKYQRQGHCVLEVLHSVAPIHGAVCCEYLWEDEAQVHN